jgi:hypothetical protein
MNGVYKVYSGKLGCMCGCRGKYSYTAEGAVKHNPGFEPNVNERSVKIILNKLLRNNNTKQEDGMLVLEQDGRVLVAWMDV